MNTIEIIERAHALLCQPGKRTKGVYARDESSEPVYGYEPSAVCFCAKGALQHVVGSEQEYRWGNASIRAQKLLDDAACKVTNDRHMSLIMVNDDGTDEELHATFHTAIAMAREQEAAA